MLRFWMRVDDTAPQKPRGRCKPCGGPGTETQRRLADRAVAWSMLAQLLPRAQYAEAGPSLDDFWPLVDERSPLAPRPDAAIANDIAGRACHAARHDSARAFFLAAAAWYRELRRRYSSFRRRCAVSEAAFRTDREHVKRRVGFDQHLPNSRHVGSYSANSGERATAHGPTVAKRAPEIHRIHCDVARCLPTLGRFRPKCGRFLPTAFGRSSPLLAQNGPTGGGETPCSILGCRQASDVACAARSFFSSRRAVDGVQSMCGPAQLDIANFSEVWPKAWKQRFLSRW